MNKNKIEPNIILTLTTNNLTNIPIIVTTKTGEILTATHIVRVGFNYYIIRKKLKSVINNLIEDYGVDTILIEQNQLFIDKIDKYPDPYVLRNVQLSYSIKVMIEDTYWEQISYILEIPHYDWQKEVLNHKVDYAIDLYKNHIKLRPDLSEEFLIKCDTNNYYETLCFSESLLHNKFLNKKYQINT